MTLTEAAVKQILTALVLTFVAPAAMAADCVGSDLLASLPQADRDAIDAASAAVPYHQGILWQASKGKARISRHSSAPVRKGAPIARRPGQCCGW